MIGLLFKIHSSFLTKKWYQKSASFGWMIVLKINVFLVTSEQIEKDTVYQYISFNGILFCENMDIVEVMSILLIISSRRKTRFEYSEIYILINSVLIKNCPSSGRNLLLCQFIGRLIKVTVVIIKVCHCYQLNTKLYPTFSP